MLLQMNLQPISKFYQYLFSDLINTIMCLLFWIQNPQLLMFYMDDQELLVNLDQLLSCFLLQYTLDFRTEGSPCLLISRFFATHPNLIKLSPFINFGVFCQSPILFQIPRLLTYLHSRQRQREAQGKLRNCLLDMLFLSHRIKLFSDYNEARHSVKRRIEQKNK